MKLALQGRWRHYFLLMRLDRPVGIYLLLWPCMWALWIAAEGVPGGLNLAVFIVGVVLMRSAGCVINDYADRDFDPHVERTKQRPIACGAVSKEEALLLAGGLALLAFLSVLLLNSLTIWLSFVAVVLAGIYPFMKRYTYLPQIFLGLAFGWGVPMAFAAETNAIPEVAWLLLAATVVWATAYDTIYAMIDREDDLKIGVRSTAILFGTADKVIIGILQALVVFILFLVGQRLSLGGYYQIALMIGALLMVYQQYLIRYRDVAGCMKAFKNNQWFGLVVFLGVVAHYAY
ncbi:4-hydroxybenzoate polyprenyltransferase [hydrothermal vent metagenome]|uniref:4-hydroxybenzoate polyprenyltransferase n=1 Tax=hydrothermal vent metagenome TaxID=652676 RepID=A0A3B0ZNB9_9ZZZZ